MVQLIVTPIDLSKPGSYRERQRYRALLRRLYDLRKAEDGDGLAGLYDEIDELIRSRLRTDDGSPVEEALDRISANQFDDLLSLISFTGSGVGEASNVPSNSGTEGTEASTPTG